MKRTILNVIVSAVIVAAVVGAVIWWQRLAAPAEKELRSAVVERSTVLVTVSANGRIEPRARVNLAFEVPGRVNEVLVEVGDPVEAGDVLAQLDSEHLALQVQRAEAALASAEAQLAQLQAGVRPEEIVAAQAKLRSAQAQVTATLASRNQLMAGATDAQIAAAEASLASATAQWEKAEDMHNMTMKCVTVNLYGQKKRICPVLGPIEEQARYGVQAADKALAVAQAQLDEALAGADASEIRAAQARVQAASAQRDALQAQLDLLKAGPSEEQVEAAKALVAQAQAALDIAELALERATLYAPFDGEVAAVNVTPGQATGGEATAIALVDNSRFHVEVEVDEVDVAGLAEGQVVEVTLDALPGVVLSGTIERIAPAAAGSGLASMGAGASSPDVVSYDMIVALGESDAPLRAGMSASALVTVKEVTDVLLIPTWVVRIDRETGQAYVQRRVGEQIERANIRLGARGSGVVQVLDGLEEGEAVVFVPQEAMEMIREAHQ